VATLDRLDSSFLAAISVGSANLTRITTKHLQTARLRFGDGGLGFLDPISVANAAFTASALNAVIADPLLAISDIPDLARSINFCFTNGTSLQINIDTNKVIPAHSRNRLPAHKRRPLTAAVLIDNPELLFPTEGKKNARIQHSIVKGMLERKYKLLCDTDQSLAKHLLFSADGNATFVTAPFNVPALCLNAKQVRSHVCMLLGLPPPQLLDTPPETLCNKCAPSQKRSTKLGSLCHHLDTCKSSPGLFPQHDTAAKSITAIINDFNIKATHEGREETDVSPSFSETKTPDIMVETPGLKFGIDVTIRRPGSNIVKPSTSLSQAFSEKLQHYYGQKNGLALLESTKTAAKNAFLIDITSTSDWALIQANVSKLPEHIKMAPSSRPPTYPIRPLVINGVSGNLEPLSKLTLTHLLMSQINRHFSHLCSKEKMALVKSKLTSISFSIISATSNVRIKNVQKFV
jgi:hypothetical protein